MGAKLSETRRVAPGAGTDVATRESVDRHRLDGASTNSFGHAQSSISELGTLMSAFATQRHTGIQLPSSFAKTTRPSDGATVFTANLTGGTAKVAVPPEPGLLGRVGEFLGVWKQAPVTCELRNQKGELLVRLALEHSADGSPDVRIASYGSYRNVAHDPTQGGWTASGPETEKALVALMKTHGEQFQEDIRTGGSIWNGRALPLQQRLRLEESCALTRALAVAEQALRGNTGVVVPRVSAESRAKGDVSPDISGIAAVTQDVTNLLAQKGGVARLRSQYPAGQISEKGNGVTIHDRQRDVTITISGPAHESFWQSVSRFMTGAPSEPRQCIVTRNDEELLKLRIDSDGKLQRIQCAGYSNLSTDSDGYMVGTDPVMRRTYENLLGQIIPLTSTFNPLAVVRIFSSADPSNAPKRYLDSIEGQAISGLLSDVGEVLKAATK